MTPEEQAAVLAEHENMVWWLASRVARGCSGADLEDVAAEVRLQFVKAAKTFEPDRGFKFSTYVTMGAGHRGHRARAKLRQGGVRFAPKDMRPALSLDAPYPDGEKGPDPEDYRRAEVEPGLHLWCSEEYSRQRRCLDWRSRVLLYLRCAEGWTLEETAEGLGCTRERIRQLEGRAVRKLAAFRNRERARKRRAGKASDD